MNYVVDKCWNSELYMHIRSLNETLIILKHIMDKIKIKIKNTYTPCIYIQANFYNMFKIAPIHFVHC